MPNLLNFPPLSTSPAIVLIATIARQQIWDCWLCNQFIVISGELNISPQFEKSELYWMDADGIDFPLSCRAGLGSPLPVAGP
jgi:hypothetical protein